MVRPRVHFTARRGWLNDPHGVTYYQGRYHLFHQYVPGQLVWGPGCNWAHAVGPDLLNWSERPVALTPGEGDDGVWTGCLVLEAGGPRIYYTSVREPQLALGRFG